MKPWFPAVAAALAVAMTAPVQAATLVTISIPVQLTNIDRTFDSFEVYCQLQGPPKGISDPPLAENMDAYKGKLVNRGFNGTVSVTYSGDPEKAQRATKAVCQLGLYSSTNPTMGFRPGTDFNVPDSFKPKPGAPFTGIITVQL